MKGVTLSTNTLVIIVLAMIVLIAVLSLVMSQYGKGMNELNMQGEKTRACNILVTSGGCDVALGTDTITVDVDTDGDPATQNTLTDLCELRNILTASDCALSCGC